MLSAIRRITVCAILLWLVSGSTAYAQPDTVTTATGEKIVGEIKKVEKDIVTIETPYSDSDFKIKWEQVVAIDSARQFMVETFDGRRLSGSLTTDVAKKAVQVGGGDHRAGRGLDNPAVRAIVLVAVRDGGRLRLQHDAGEPRQAAHARRQPFVQGREQDRHRPGQRVQELPVECARDAAVGSRERLPVSAGRPLVREHEPGLPEQRRAGPRPPHDDWRRRRAVLLRSSSQYLAVGGGLAWTREDYTDPAIETKDSGEAYIGTEFMTEKLKIADLVTRFNYYPSLTIDNRYRINYTFDLDFNLPGDWYIRVSLFENYDSKPPSGLSNNDYGWSNAFGFKF